MDRRFTHQVGDLRIEWVQNMMGVIPLSTWHAYLIEPVRTLSFAYVATDYMVNGSARCTRAGA
jgi:hypothetical protein